MYQVQERQDELGLNWDSFKWRNYDYAIGRFMSIDPLAEKYAYNLTYAFQENKMGMGRELEGLELVPHDPTASFGNYIKSKVDSGVHKVEQVVSKVIDSTKETLKAGQQLVNENKTEIVSFSKEIQKIGEKTTTTGLAAAAAGAPFEGVGAAPLPHESFRVAQRKSTKNKSENPALRRFLMRGCANVSDFAPCWREHLARERKECKRKPRNWRGFFVLSF